MPAHGLRPLTMNAAPDGQPALSHIYMHNRLIRTPNLD